MKVVTEELCVSRWTLWRARQCRLPGFPPPVRRLGRLYWRERDLEKLDDALMLFPGRMVFDRNREKRPPRYKQPILL